MKSQFHLKATPVAYGSQRVKLFLMVGKGLMSIYTRVHALTIPSHLQWRNTLHTAIEDVHCMEERGNTGRTPSCIGHSQPSVISCRLKDAGGHSESATCLSALGRLPSRQCTQVPRQHQSLYASTMHPKSLSS